MKARPEAGRAFTLVELLVVIGIIAVLAALIFPAVSSVRNQGNVTRSTAHLRQLAAAALAYCADHDGRMLPHAIFDPAINENREWCFAYGRRNSQEGFKAGILGPYLENLEAIIQDPCWPVPAEIQAALKRQGKPAAVGYGYNGWGLSQKVDVRNGHWEGYPIGSVARPARTALFATSGWFFSGRVMPSENIWSPQWETKEPSLRAVVGQNRALVAWLGGQVTQEPLRLDPGVPAGEPRVGWLDPTDAERAAGDLDLFDRE